MSCCNNSFPYGTAHPFRMRCSNPCVNTNSGEMVNVDYLEIAYDTTVGIGVVDGAASFVAPEVLVDIPFNTVINLIGAAISPNTSTGVITINESGLYKISYSAAWNTIQWNLAVSTIVDANTFRQNFILVDSPLTSSDQILGNSSDDCNFTASETNKISLMKTGTSTVLLNAGDTLRMQVYQNGTVSGSPGYTSLFSSTVADINSGIYDVSKITIFKVK
jgi:hypothetical protein